MSHLLIVVPGRPVAQGSMRSFGPRSVVPSNQQQLMVFRRAVLEAWGGAAIEEWGDPNHPPSTHGITLSIDFIFTRPRTHYLPVNRKRAVRELRGEAPDVHTQHPDVDKMCRAVMDALTGHAFVDDAQVTRLMAQKRWADDGEVERTVIYVQEV